VYLDTDVVLAQLKVDDWLAADVDAATLDAPKTSVATAVEVQYVMEEEWSRERVAEVHAEIEGEGIELRPLTVAVMDAASHLRQTYDRLNVFDGVHLGCATVLEETIVSTDTLYPAIAEIEHVDPRDLD
jgi:predicted nucleic acid-binding protein